MVVPVWQTLAAISVSAALAVLVGLSILIQGPKSMPNPAYRVMNNAATWWVWGLAFLVPGVATLGLIFSKWRKRAQGWLLWIGGLETFMAVSLVPFVAHRHIAILSVFLLLALALLSFLAALKSTLLP